MHGLGGHSRYEVEIMIKRHVILLFVVFVLLFSVAVKAALPALVLPFIAEAVEAIVVRSAGRQIVSTLGTAAANDSSFVAAVAAIRGTQIAQWLGFGVVAGAFPVNLDIPVSPTLAKERYLVQIGQSTDDSYKPAKVSPGYVITIYSNVSPWDTYKIFGKTRDEAVSNWMAIVKTDPRYVQDIMPTEWKPYSSKWGDDSQENWTFVYGNAQNPLSNSNYLKGVFRADAVEPRDGQRRILIQNGQFLPDISDPDWSESEARDFGKQSSFGFVSKNGSNDPIRVGFTATPAQVNVKADIQSLAPDGKPQIVSRAIQFSPGTGQAISTSSEVKVGQTLETAPSDWSSPDNNSGSSIEWPTDYARDATVSNVSKSVEKLNDDLTKKTEIQDPQLEDLDGLKKIVFFGDYFNKLLAFNFPPHVSTCPIIEFEAVVGGVDLHPKISAQCDFIKDSGYKETVGLAFGVVYLVLGFRIVMEA